MNLPKRIAAVALLAAALATPALAQTAAQATQQAPTVTAPATAAHTPPTPAERAARFDKADANKDGKLTKAEFTASLKGDRAAKADKIWARINPTGKDSVTKAEYLAAPMGHGKGAPKAS